MLEEFCRTEIVYGTKAMERLANSRVLIFGVGGVGGYVVEALARSGVGALDLVDNDTVARSNINRQIIATQSTVGKYKVDVAADRVHDINPDCDVRTYKCFYLPETKEQFDFTQYDYVVDAIDTVTGKLSIIEEANKIHPAAFEVAAIYETSICPLAKVMRKECKKRGIDSLKVVYSKEAPREPHMTEALVKEMEAAKAAGSTRRSIPGSTAFAPSVAGLIAAAEIVNDLCVDKKGI